MSRRSPPIDACRYRAGIRRANMAGLVICAAMALVWVGPFGPGMLAEAGDSPESPQIVKAQDLVKMIPFVVWPPAALGDPGAAFTLCVVGDDPFGPLLDQTVAGQVVDGRAMTVRRMSRLAAGVSCQIVYAAGSGEQPVADILRQLHGQPVLTVTDRAADGTQGVVDFVISDGQVRFDIDDQAAAENNLTISSKLLGLALAVRARK